MNILPCPHAGNPGRHGARAVPDASARRLLVVIAGALVFSTAGEAASPPAARETPPAVSREFRGVWIATKANIDWPSRPGLPVPQQKAELIKILDHAVRLRLNAVILQVRPAGDAFYASHLEPWSEYLTGTMGAAPAPFYDPLAFAVMEAHRRGLELHAWFNPFRARIAGAKSAPATNHISVTRPAWVGRYGETLWQDPADPGVQRHALHVMLDVLRRYDVDGIHIDDYFYPYPEKNVPKAALDGLDERSWQRYRAVGGALARDDWRRAQVNEFVRTLHARIKAEKPFVKFGVSPFGIWRPGHPPAVEGLDAYAELFADARLWLREGWLDYCAPQLYWAIQAPKQSYPELLDWWRGQNPRGRHLWPGNYSGRFPPAEIIEQVRITRARPDAGGNIFFNATSLTTNGYADAFTRQLYTEPALVPASPWLDNQPPPAPRVAPTVAGGGKRLLRWQPGGTETIWLWVVQTRAGSVWKTDVVPGQELSRELDGRVNRAAVRAVDRSGNLSPPVTLDLTQPPGPTRLDPKIRG